MLAPSRPARVWRRPSVAFAAGAAFALLLPIAFLLVCIAAALPQ